MDQERKTRLEEIGFYIDLNLKDKWNLQFKKLRDYSVKHGHCELVWAVDRFYLHLQYPPLTVHTTRVSLRIAGLVPKTCKENPSLGRWVANQRARFKKGRMDQERKRRLDEIGFYFTKITYSS
jgi:hypothetical protein